MLLALWLSMSMTLFRLQHSINLPECTFYPNSSSEKKAAAVHRDTGDLVTLKKKLKIKKKRLKEEVGLWEESRRCSVGQNNEPEAEETPSKMNPKENGKTHKQSTGV